MVKAKVLIIEDDPDQVFLYSTKFKMEGYEVLAATDGLSGIKLAKEKQPDIILLDIVMADVDGVTVLRELKKLNATKKIPVVIFTNLDKKELINEARKLGAAEIFIKTDFVPSAVVAKVAKILTK